MNKIELLQLAASIRTEARRLGATKACEAYRASHEVLWKTKLNHALFVCDKVEELIKRDRLDEASAELCFVKGILWFSGMSLDEIEELIGTPVKERLNEAS